MKDEKFGQIIEQIQQLNQGMAAHDENPWQIEQKVLDLQTQLGYVAKAALEKGKFKPGQSELGRAGERLATILILLIDISDEFGVDLPTALSQLISKNSKEN